MIQHKQYSVFCFIALIWFLHLFYFQLYYANELFSLNQTFQGLILIFIPTTLFYSYRHKLDNSMLFLLVFLFLLVNLGYPQASFLSLF